jgi:hypothetical protein
MWADPSGFSLMRTGTPGSSSPVGVNGDPTLSRMEGDRFRQEQDGGLADRAEVGHLADGLLDLKREDVVLQAAAFQFAGDRVAEVIEVGGVVRLVGVIEVRAGDLPVGLAELMEHVQQFGGRDLAQVEADGRRSVRVQRVRHGHPPDTKKGGNRSSLPYLSAWRCAGLVTDWSDHGDRS